MFLLAAHYAIQPRLSKKYIQTSSRSVALVEEVTKTTMAAFLFACQPVKQVSDWTLSSSLTVAALPAVLYAVQGVLQYASHQHLDPVTFNGLSQTKTLSAALWCYILLGKSQSPLQLVALVLLFGSAVLFQGKTAKQTTDHFWQGVIPCVSATMISGLAGALSQKGLQFTGGQGRYPFFYAMEVSFYSAVTLIVTHGADWKGFFDGWTWQTMIPVVCKAAGGILTVLVHKYTGTVSKGFALMFGLVLAGTMQSTLSREPMGGHQIIGTLLVMVSGWLHFTQTR
jgi:UDP-sugar transporter A1/2/3